ncbi:hypothetical protein [Amycolatopsis mediterranei]|nr:hypothetical protein [Amycolatopsis mediterranei]UZF68861.1 hypothetical protein ISP_001967 [Amycolatopsis mediterranei]
MTHQRPPQRVAPRDAGVPSRRIRRNGPGLFHVLEVDGCKVMELPVEE